MPRSKVDEPARDSARDVPAKGWRALRWSYAGNAVRAASQFVIGAWLIGGLLNVLEARWSDLLASLTWPFIVSVAAAGMTLGSDHAASGLGTPARPGVDVAAAATLLVCARLLGGRRWLSGPTEQYWSPATGCPGSFRAWMNV